MTLYPQIFGRSTCSGEIRPRDPSAGSSAQREIVMHKNVNQPLRIDLGFKPCSQLPHPTVSHLDLLNSADYGDAG